MTGSGWSELVTTALLGTDRRPLPPELLEANGHGVPGRDPAGILLSAGARHRAVARASAPLQRCSAAPTAPPPDLPDAPQAAQELLHQMLAKPLPELVNAWLAAAQVRAVRAAPQDWSDLAALAGRRADYDRQLLARAVGRQGSWFLDQNPDWQRLAEEVRRELQVVPGPTRPKTKQADQTNQTHPDRAEQAGQPGQTGRAAPDPPVPGMLDLRGRPEAALEVPAPWPRALTAGALQVLLAGQLGWRASRYGAAVGARMAVADADLLQQAADALPGVVTGGGPGLRLAHEALAAVEQSVRLRGEIERTFDPPDQADPDPGPPTHAQEDLDDRA